MIFALVDYLQYRWRRGRYSERSLEEKNLRRATEENFADFRDYSLGDMLYVSTADSFKSWIVMYWTNAVISHVATFYGDGILHDCTTGGVIRHSFSDYLDGKSYLGVMRLPAGLDKEKMKAFLDRTVGDGYNWRGVFRLALLISSGAHPSFSWRLYLDIALIIASLIWVFILVPVTLAVVPMIGLIALTVVVFRNRIYSDRWAHHYKPQNAIPTAGDVDKR